MNNNNNFIDTCRLLGNYNGENIYLYSCAKYDKPRIFILQIIIIYLNGHMLINYHYYKLSKLLIIE